MTSPPDPIYIFKGEMSGISCLACEIVRDGGFLYAGTETGPVHVWNLKTKRETGSFDVGGGGCISVNVPADEDVVITRNKSGSVAFWKKDGGGGFVSTKQVETEFFGFSKSVVFRRRLYVPLKNSKCQIFSIESKETEATIDLDENGRLGEITSLLVTEINDREAMMVAHEASAITLWDAKDGVETSRLRTDEHPTAFDFDAKKRTGMCGSPSLEILVFSLDENLRFRIEKRIALTNPGAACVRIRPDGKLVAVGCWDGKLRLYSWKSFVLLAALDVHSMTVQDAAFLEGPAAAAAASSSSSSSSSSDRSGKRKRLLAAGSRDGKISLWDAYD